MPVAIEQWILWPLLLNLVLLIGCWVYYVFIQRDGASQYGSSRSRIYRCERCRYVYLDTRDLPMAKCPKCGNLNEAVKT